MPTDVANPIKPPNIAILAALAACGPLALNLYVPALPAVAEQYQASPGAVQWTLTLYFVGVALGQIVYGPLSDMIGRRRLVLTGVALYLLACLACSLAPSLGFLIVARFAQACGGCVGMVMSRAILQDVYPRERFASALSTVVMASAVAPMLAPTIGGYVTQFIGWPYVFLPPAVLALVLLAACVRHLPETHFQRLPVTLGSLMGSYPATLRNGRFMLKSAVAALISSTYFTFMAAGPYLAIGVLRLSPSEYGTVAMTATFGFILGNALSRTLSLRLSGMRVALIGCAVTAAGIALQLALVGLLPLSLSGLFFPMVVISCGHGLAMASVIGIAMAALPHLRGTASAVIGFLQMCFAALASEAGSASVTMGAVATITVMAVIHCLAVILLGLSWKLDTKIMT